MNQASGPAEVVSDIHEIDPAVLARRKMILFVTCAALISTAMSVSSLNVAIPTIQRDLHASATQLQWIVEAYVLVFAGLLLPAGALGDRFGRRRLLLIGLLIYGGALTFGSFASSPAHLIVARAVMGVGAACVMPTTLSIVVASHPVHERPRAVAQWAATAAVGGVIGPITTSLVIQHFSWGAAFLANAMAVAVMLVVSAILVPDSRDPELRPVGITGSALAVAAVVCLVFGIIEAPEKGWSSATTLVAVALSLVAAIGFVMSQLRSEHPMLDPRLFRLHGFRTGALAIFLVFYSIFGMFFLVTQYVQFVKGYSPMAAAFMLMPSAVAIIVVGRRSHALSVRFGPAWVVRTGMLSAATGYVALASLRPSSPLAMVPLAIVCIGTGTALIMPLATQQIVNSLPLGKSGVGSAMNDLTREIGGALGLAVSGSIVTTVYRRALFTDSVTDPALRAAAGESIGRAIAAARSMTPSPETQRTIDGARRAFTDGTRSAFAVLAVFAVLAAFALTRPTGRTPTSRLAPSAGSASTGD